MEMACFSSAGLSEFGRAPTGRGTIFISRSKFLSYRGRGSPDGPADEQLFARQNFLCPAVGLSRLDASHLQLAPSPTGLSTEATQKQRHGDAEC